MRKQTRNTEMAVSPVILQATSKHTASVSITANEARQNETKRETKFDGDLIDNVAFIQHLCVIQCDVPQFRSAHTN